MVSCYGAKLFYIETTPPAGERPGRRIAFTFARKFGNAVERNRSRRLSREAYRHLRPRLAMGYDMVLLVYPLKPDSRPRLPDSAVPAPENDFEQRLRQLKTLFGRAGLWQTAGQFNNEESPAVAH
jgi:ribonuclease P protein component